MAHDDVHHQQDTAVSTETIERAVPPTVMRASAGPAPSTPGSEGGRVQRARVPVFTPLPDLPSVEAQETSAGKAPEAEHDDSSGTEDEDGELPREVRRGSTPRPSLSQLSHSGSVQQEVGDCEAAASKGTKRPSQRGAYHTNPMPASRDGFAGVSSVEKASKTTRDLADAITTNANACQVLADRVRALERGEGGHQDARCISDLGAYKKAVEDLALEVRELQRRPHGAGLEGAELESISHAVEEARHYMAKLAQTTADIASVLRKKGDEIAALKQEVNTLRFRSTLQNARTPLPALPIVPTGGSTQTTRARSPSLEIVSPAAKRVRTSDAVASSDSPAGIQVFWGFKLGPYPSFGEAKGRSILTEVNAVLDELEGASSREGPYAVLPEKNGNFVLVYFLSKTERNAIHRSWPPTDPKYKNVRMELKDGLAPPPPQALFKVFRGRKPTAKANTRA